MTHFGYDLVNRRRGRVSDLDIYDWLEKLAGERNEIKPYVHQTKAINKLIRQGGSVIMAHPVGSGKTLTSVMGMEEMRKRGMANKALVLTPASLRNNYAQNGIGLVTDHPYAVLGNKQEVASGEHKGLKDLTGNEKYVVVSYDMFKRDPEKYLRATGADTVIADEMHRAKDDKSNVYESLRRTRKMYKNFVGMTGSIVSNQPSEIYPLVDIVSNGMHRLGRNIRDFDHKFFKRDYSESRKGVIAGLKNVNILKSELGKTVHYIDADDLDKSNMPKKVVTDVHVPMSKGQVKLYNKAMEQVPLALRRKMERGDPLTEGELTKYYNTAITARQISNGVHIATEGMSLEQSAKSTPKIAKMLDDVEEHLADTPDGQVIITSNLINGGADVVEAGLQDRGLDYGIFIGKGNKGITERSRQQDVEDYNQGKKRIILISGAGGEGISLNDTTMIASLDGHYNPEKISQMEARGVRSGGQSKRPLNKRRVEVRRYQSVLPTSRIKSILPRFMRRTPGTIDQQIYGIAQKKADTNKILVDVLRKQNQQ